MPDPTPADHLAWAICAAIRPERDDDGERPCRVPCLACRAGAAAVIRAAADQVDAVNVPDHIRGEGYWAYRNGRAAAKDYLIAKAAELEVPHV